MAKKAVSDRLLARYQKDLSAWEVRYQRGIDERIAETGQDLATIYRRTANSIERTVEPLFKEYVRIKDIPGMEGRASSIFHKMERLTATGGEIANDLSVLEGKIQPYYTEAIGNEFRRSYYEQGFGLSKSAEIAVNVPILTDSHVMGVIANPWLGDGANYAARIGRNTQHLADAMKDVISKATVEGFGWSEGAKRIQEATGEAYNAAVTLFRTEANRASSLGSSYGGMKNADILDGKRWNATLDSVTAPRDAANEDLPPFDLDYDTPDNPGVPGIRIPNHPNCRCKWTMILSALGINTKGRIARFDGERSYTDAKTYREWSDEVGLPNLDKRLERDSLKSYLRPGESLEDLNKRVVRRKAPGGTVTVPKAPWDTPKGTPPAPPNVAPKVAPVKEVNKALGETKPVFRPEKTTAEATKWGKANLGIDHVDYKGFHVDVANDVNSSLLTLREQFPEVKGTKWVTTSQARNKALYDRQLTQTKSLYKDAGYNEDDALKFAKRKVKRRTVSSQYASSSNSSWGPQEGICFNRKWAKDPLEFTKSLEKNVKVGWGVEGGGTPGSVVSHEFGHQLDNFLGSKGQRGWIDGMYNEFMQDAANASVRTGAKIAATNGATLSQYAATNSKEFFAEAFTEYLHSETPRPTAVKVFKRLEEALEVIRKG